MGDIDKVRSAAKWLWFYWSCGEAMSGLNPDTVPADFAFCLYMLDCMLNQGRVPRGPEHSYGWIRGTGKRRGKWVFTAADAEIVAEYVIEDIPRELDGTRALVFQIAKLIDMGVKVQIVREVSDA